MKTFGDETGFFWNQPVKVKVGRSASGGGPRAEVVRERRIKTPPPPSSYKLPELFPQLGKYDRIVLDLETYDPHLKEKGSGVYRKDGFIVGVGVKTDGWAGDYYPVAHKDAPNCDPEKVFSWLREELKDFSGELVGANLLYEGDWTGAHGVAFPKAKIRDVQWAEPLLNENLRRYNLESIAQRWLGEGKRTNLLKELYGPDYIYFMHKTHPGYAKDYVMGDLELPEQILPLQIEQLKKEDLYDLFLLESRLYPVLLHMRQRGVRIDLQACDRVGEILSTKKKEANEKIKYLVGFDINVWSSNSIARAFDKLGIEYPRTEPSSKAPKGNPSFTKEWLGAHPHPIADLVMEVRKCDKFDGTFVEKFKNEAIGDRIHCLFHPLRSDDGGTVTGRFSSSNPNLQQVPTRDEFFGPLIRGLFIPDEGKSWWSMDYSQMEYRLLVHFSVLAHCVGADEAARMYREDPTTDFHRFASEITGLPRKQAKNINFGIVYGMGEDTMATNMGITPREAAPILKTYHSKLPFCRAVYKLATNRALNSGFVRTILRRKRRFDLWEPAVFEKDPSKRKPALPREQALEEYGKNIRRAFAHKALNAVLQGSNADTTKKAMVDMWEAGIIGPNKPLDCQLTVHDELDGSVDESKKENKEALEFGRRLMMHAVPLQIPVLVEGSTGKNWAEAH